MATVSVIMATFNCERTIKRAIDSILNQTFRDWEFVICDDCSTDRTKDILDEYQKKYPEKFIIIQNNRNSKLPFSLNHCLKYARGEFIARMDGDDVSLPDRFEKQVTFLNENPKYQVVGTSMTRFDEQGEYDKYEAVKSPNRYTLLTQVPFCHATIMMRKKAYDELHGYEVKKRTERGQDLDLWFRFYEKGFEGSNISDSLYLVCENRDAIKRRKFKYTVYATQTKLIGFRKLHYPIVKYYLAFLPILSFFIPRSWKLKHRRANSN